MNTNKTGFKSRDIRNNYKYFIMIELLAFWEDELYMHVTILKALKTYWAKLTGLREK